MNCLVSNSRGTGVPSFPRLLREMISMYKVDFIALLETRCSGRKSSEIVSKLGLKYSDRVDAEGFKGGIWILWSDKLKSVEVLTKHSRFIHLKVIHSDNTE